MNFILGYDILKALKPALLATELVLLLGCFSGGFCWLSSSSLYSVTNLLTLKHSRCETS